MNFLSGIPWQIVGATIVLTTATRNALADVIGPLLNSGTAEFQTSGDVEVATCTFGATAFGAATAGVATANAIADDTNATGGTIEHVKLKNSSGTEILEADATPTGGGGSFEGATLVIAAAETVSITSLTITQPAS